MNKMIKCVLPLLFLVCMTTLAAGQQIDVGQGYQYSTIADGINAARENAGDIILVHPGTYYIGTISLKSGITLQGSGYGDTIIFGSSTSGGVEGSQESSGWLKGDGISNVEISGFRFTSDASGIGDGGHGETRNCILLKDCSNVKIHNLYFQRYLYNDGVKVHGGDNIHVYDCIAKSVGHDFVEFLNGNRDSTVTNCLIDVQTNTGIRFDDTINCKASQITIYDDQGSGWCAFEIEDTMTNCVIDRCIVRNFHGSTSNTAIQYVHADGSLTVSNCVGWDNNGVSGSPNMVNTNFDVSPQDESYWVSQGYGYNGDTITIPTTPNIQTSSVTPVTLATPISTITITTPSAYYMPLVDPNIDELDFSESIDSTKTEPGTGKYQPILSYSSMNPNYVKMNEYTRSVFWYFPDSFMSGLYGSSILSYQPAAKIITQSNGQPSSSVTNALIQSKLYM